MATAFPKLPKSTVHLLTVPAQEAQVDYGYVGIINKRKTYAFVMTLKVVLVVRTGLQRF